MQGYVNLSGYRIWGSKSKLGTKKCSRTVSGAGEWLPNNLVECGSEKSNHRGTKGLSSDVATGKYRCSILEATNN